MAVKKSRFIWFRGELVPWDQATTHVLSHGLHYGSSVFEGLRAYDTSKGAAIFRLRDHTARLFDSAKIHRMELGYSEDEINEACRTVIRVNGLTSAYIRPIAYRGFGDLSLTATKSPVEVSIAAFEWGAYLGQEALEQGVDTCISSWRRPSPGAVPSAAKAGGNYLANQLIGSEAVRNGYAEGIALDHLDFVSEGSGENIFVIRRGEIATPPAWSSILPGLTRDSVMQLADSLGLSIVERPITRQELYIADELFFTGTAAEITPIRSVDGVVVGEGKRGPMTQAFQDAFFGLFSGATPDGFGWLDYVKPKVLEDDVDEVEAQVA
ncbi:MAG: branched-chain amino acid transaminase [Deltaproteobacteria bacterium]|nr:branched-chain amino acid transaminase [Deltaproteobacteria bacterium]